MGEKKIDRYCLLKRRDDDLRMIPRKLGGCKLDYSAYKSPNLISLITYHKHDKSDLPTNPTKTPP